MDNEELQRRIIKLEEKILILLKFSGEGRITFSADGIYLYVMDDDYMITEYALPTAGKIDNAVATGIIFHLKDAEDFMKGIK